MKIGYARCSTADQILDWQLDALKKEGCERIYEEKMEERLVALAKAIKQIVDDKSRYVDRSTRSDRRAELKMDIVIALSDNGYPPYTKDEVFKEILEQAENFKRHSSTAVC